MSRRTRLNHLRAFDAAARHLSFSVAAGEMNLTQAAVSQQIARLEESLGATLFIRHNRALSLSERGQAYALVVREVLDRLDTVTAQIFPSVERGTVSVRCTPSVASLWLAPRLAAFHRLHPEINVRIRTLDLFSDRGKPVQGDLAIFRGTAGQRLDADTRLLWTAEIFPVCAPAYLTRRGPLSTVESVAGCDLIEILGYENNWHRWMRSFAPGRMAPVPAVTVDGLIIAIELACRGEGVILGRRPMIDTYLADGRLVRVLDGASLQSPYYLRLHSGASRYSAARRLADWMCQAAAEAGPA